MEAVNDWSVQVIWPMESQGSQHRECLMEFCFIPKVQSPTQSHRRPNSAGFRAEWHLLWCNILFPYTHFLFANPILLQHIGWPGPAEPEHLEYLPNGVPGASLQACWEMTLGFRLNRNLHLRSSSFHITVFTLILSQCSVWVYTQWGACYKKKKLSGFYHIQLQHWVGEC